MFVPLFERLLRGLDVVTTHPMPFAASVLMFAAMSLLSLRFLITVQHPPWLVLLAAIASGILVLPVLLIMPFFPLYPVVIGGVGFVVWLNSSGLSWWQTLFQQVNLLHLATFVLVLVAVFLVQASLIADAVLPANIDPVHHTLLAYEIVEQRQLPATLPDSDGSPLVYHIGVHTVLAGIDLLLPGPPDVARVLLILGPLLLSNYAIGLYVLVRTLSLDHWCGLGAMLIGSVAFSMPAQLLNWGKFPLLMALATFSGALVLLILFAGQRATFMQRAWVGLLLAGGILTHTRLLFVWVAVAGVIGLAMWRRKQALLRVGLPFIVPTIAIAVLWWIPNWQQWYSLTSDIPWEDVDTAFVSTDSPEIVYFRFDRNELLWVLLMVGGFTLSQRQFLYEKTLVMLALFLLVASVAVYSSRLPGGRPLDAPFVHAALVLPLVLGLALVMGYAQSWFQRRWLRFMVPLAFSILLLVGMSSHPEPCCQIATRADLEAIEWLNMNGVASARIGIAVVEWEDNEFVGADGGYWLNALSENDTTLPSLFYGFGTALTQAKTNRTAARFDVAVRSGANLCAFDVDYVYVGSASNSFNADTLTTRPDAQLVYSKDGVRLYEIICGNTNNR